MLKRILLAIVVLLKIFVQVSHASERNLDELIQTDREERIKKINELTIELNKSLEELSKFKADLDKGLARETRVNAPKITIRNGSAVIAALGFIGTIIYQTKGVHPNKIFLSGGYALSTIAVIVNMMENHSIRLTREEVERLKASVKDLEDKIENEKINIAREIRLLCLSDGGSPEICDQFAQLH